MISQHFPITEKIQYPRLAQIELMMDTDKLLYEGKNRIIICAPCGIGKSGYAIAVLNKYGGLYTSPLNALVDQVNDDFEGKYTTTLKGRAHYLCVAKSGLHTCEYGYCQFDKCAMNPKEKRNCDSCYDKFNCVCNGCKYKRAMRRFKESKIGNTNFSMFQLGINNDKDMIIIDECDDVEPFVRLSNTVTVNEQIKSSDFRYHVERLTDIKAELESELEIYDETFSDKQKKKHQRQIGAIDKLLTDFVIHEKPWCISYPNNNKTQYQPITIDRFLEPLLQDKIVIMMSATPVHLEGYEVIEVGSPFDPKIRPWQFKPLGKMSMKNRNETLPKVSEFLQDLRGKTVVHCNSYAVAGNLAELLRMDGIEPLTQVNFDSNHYAEHNRKDIVKVFKQAADQNTIMLSVNLARGVDFPEKDIVNNVIAVMPWPNPTDPLTKAKNKQIGTKWQAEAMANTIMQAYGRVNRNDKKTTMTYIIDSNFNDLKGKGTAKEWFNKHNDNFYNWFLEAQINE